MIKTIATTLLKLIGWQVSFSLPPRDKYVLICAPHTSNWDFPLGLLGMLACGLRFNWVGKHTLFKGPLGPIMRAIGGIPVDRFGSVGFLKKVINIFASRDQFVMAISPEGTRSLTKQWKEGFIGFGLMIFCNSMIKLRQRVSCAVISCKKRVALAARTIIMASNNTLDASRKLCAPSGVTYIRKTPPTHLVSSAHQGGYLFLGGML